MFCDDHGLDKAEIDLVFRFGPENKLFGFDPIEKFFHQRRQFVRSTYRGRMMGKG